MQTYEALAGRTAVVTGAASGMGSAVATPADLADPASIEALADTVHLAIGPVDLVVNAAGVMLPNPITEGSADEWQRMLETNLAGPLRMVRAFSPDLIKAAAENRAADLVNISSVAAHIPIPEYAVYNASKAAMTHLSDSLSRELGPQNVRVSNIEPGLTNTELSSHIDNDAHAAWCGRSPTNSCPGCVPSLLPEQALEPHQVLLESEEFRALWASYPVSGMTSGPMRINHPVVGIMDLRFEALTAPDEPDQLLVSYIADSGSPTAGKLRRLAR
jgi:NAD(P)-dependent dehydrogenase (short-subunit alcohol dehydrogenase family)